jgi:hypothetical protein
MDLLLRFHHKNYHLGLQLNYLHLLDLHIRLREHLLMQFKCLHVLADVYRDVLIVVVLVDLVVDHVVDLVVDQDILIDVPMNVLKVVKNVLDATENIKTV